MFALLVNQHDERHYYSQLKNIDEQLLPSGNDTVNAEWSSLNYKDAQAITGKGKGVIGKSPDGGYLMRIPPLL